MTRDAIWLDIVAERFRQKRLISEGKFDRDMAAPAAELSAPEKLGVLAEEFGEVARVVAEAMTTHAARAAGPDLAHLREELVQLAACCVGWVEELDEVPQEVTLAELARQVGAPAPARYNADPFKDGLPIEVFAVQPGAS